MYVIYDSIAEIMRSYNICYFMLGTFHNNIVGTVDTIWEGRYRNIMFDGIVYHF